MGWCPCLWGAASNDSNCLPVKGGRVASDPDARDDQPNMRKRNSFSAGLTALWNALEKGDENKFLDQSSVIGRALPALRAGSKAPTDFNYAASCAQAAGVSTEPAKWGKDMKVHNRYTGPHVRWPLTLQNVREVLNHVRTRPEVSIHPKYVAEILANALLLLKEEVQTAVFDMDIPKGTPEEPCKLIICGDTHGHLEDFLFVMEQHGEPSDKVSYLMNGDLVDRGPNGSEIVILCLLYKLLCPSSMVINRGNHENVQINRRRSEDGGGFYDEVMSKYASSSSDQNIFFMFQQLFEYLPLATLICNKVFVIHGGLFRYDTILLSDIRKINRVRQCPMSTIDREDSIMFDSMWSDPQDTNGVSPSHRGSNCVKFGPDVTKKFVKNNNLSFVIRSHELPNSNRGFEEIHDGKLITLFTASDYCGFTGNSGAVMEMKSDLSWVATEHMAWMKEPRPPGKGGAADPAEPCFAGEEIEAVSSAAPEFYSTTRANPEQRERRNSDIQREVVAKVKHDIMQNKDALFRLWSGMDTGGTGQITMAQWRQGVCDVLDLPITLPWDQLQDMILDNEEFARDGVVRYRQYLHRPTTPVLVRAATSPIMGDECRQQVINKFFETIIAKDYTVRDTVKTFDKNGDGMVSAAELRQYLKETLSDLPETQISAILRAMECEDSSRGELTVSLDDFLSRFQVMYKENKGATISERVAKQLSELGRKLIGSSTRQKVFESIDTSGNGYLERGEFMAALDALGMAEDPAREELWGAVDINGDGHVNFVEFCSSFELRQTEYTQDLGKTIWESILTSLSRNAISLDFVWRFFDPRNEGKITAEDFKVGFKALNRSLQGNGLLTDEQLDVVVSYLDQDHDGMIAHSEWVAVYS